MNNIIECGSFLELNKLVFSSTLVIFDLDNTLIEPCTQFGSYQWGKYIVKKLFCSGMTFSKALEIGVEIWEIAQQVVSIKPVEKKSFPLFKLLHDNKIPILALTGRRPKLKQLTLSQLKLNGLTFDQNTIFFESCDIEAPFPSCFQDGVIFSGYKNKKSHTLFQFLNSISFKAKKIVYIDDQISYIEDIQVKAEELAIPFIGIRYGGSDKNVDLFDPKKVPFPEKLFDLLSKNPSTKKVLHLFQPS